MAKKGVSKKIRPTTDQLQTASWYNMDLYPDLVKRYALIDLRLCRDCWKPFCLCNINKEAKQYADRSKRNEEAARELEEAERNLLNGKAPRRQVRNRRDERIERTNSKTVS